MMTRLLFLPLTVLYIIWVGDLKTITFWNLSLGLLYSFSVLSFVFSGVIIFSTLLAKYLPAVTKRINTYRDKNKLTFILLPNIDKFNVVNIKSATILLILSYSIILVVPYIYGSIEYSIWWR